MYEPSTCRCLLRYRLDESRFASSATPAADTLQYVIERNGMRRFVTATPKYLQLLEPNHPVNGTLALVLTLVATAVAVLVALVIRARLTGTDREVTAYRGSLDNKEALTGAIHTIVFDNLTQLMELAQHVKEAPNVADAERRYLNIALFEMSHMRLGLYAKIRADRDARERGKTPDDWGVFSIKEVARTVEAELNKRGSDECI